MTALGLTARITFRDVDCSALVERKGLHAVSRSSTGHDVANRA
jgi:hypothetical protein